MLTITPQQVLNNPDSTTREIIADGTIVLTGNYGGATTHGDTCNLQQLGDYAKSSQQPTKVEVFEITAAGTAPTFAQYVYCPGTNQTNGVVSIAVAGTELTQASAYSAGQLAAALRIRAWFPAY